MSSYTGNLPDRFKSIVSIEDSASSSGSCSAGFAVRVRLGWVCLDPGTAGDQAVHWTVQVDQVGQLLSRNYLWWSLDSYHTRNRRYV